MIPVARKRKILGFCRIPGHFHAQKRRLPHSLRPPQCQERKERYATVCSGSLIRTHAPGASRHDGADARAGRAWKLHPKGKSACNPRLPGGNRRPGLCPRQAGSRRVRRVLRPDSSTIGSSGPLWWAGLQNSAPLQALAQSAQNALRAEGFVLENRSFVPHITLARQVSAPTPLRLAVPSASCTAGRVSLMRSDRVNGVLRYTEIYAPSLSKAL